MKSDLTLIVEIFRKEHRSKEEREFVYSQLILLGDLRQYLYDLSETMKSRLLAALALEFYPAGHVLFHKGDRSDKMFVLFSGSLDMYDDQPDAPPVLIATLSVGKMIGERGLVKHTTRMLTAIARVDSYVLSLDLFSFTEILRPAIALRMEEKAGFIDRFLPRAKPLPSSVKERLAYALSQRFFHRGAKLLTQGDFSLCLFFVKSGECAVTTYQRANIVTLTAGCWCGEESVFLNRPSSYTVSVSSEVAWVYALTKAETIKFIPESIADIMKKQCVWKDSSRKSLQLKLNWTAKGGKEAPKDSSETDRFRLASVSAKRSLMKVISRSSSTKIDDVKPPVRLFIKQKLRGATPMHRRCLSDIQLQTERLFSCRHTPRLPSAPKLVFS